MAEEVVDPAPTSSFFSPAAGYRLVSVSALVRNESGSDALSVNPLYFYLVDDYGFLFFQLVSSCYERGSVIVTSNKPFTAWGEIFGDPVVAAAMIDRLVHHAEILSRKGDSYRLRDKRLSDDRPKFSAQAALA